MCFIYNDANEVVDSVFFGGFLWWGGGVLRGERDGHC